MVVLLESYIVGRSTVGIPTQINKLLVVVVGAALLPACHRARACCVRAWRGSPPLDEQPTSGRAPARERSQAAPNLVSTRQGLRARLGCTHRPELQLRDGKSNSCVLIA